jgi:hypothetical protein
MQCRLGNKGALMKTHITFLECPAYIDKKSNVRCGLPAAVTCRYIMNSTDGPLESAMIRCPSGHFFSGPIEFLTYEKRAHAKDEAGIRSPGERAAASGAVSPRAGLLLRLSRCAVNRGAPRSAEGRERLLHGHQPGAGGRRERAG